jgi:hypothetical protein
MNLRSKRFWLKAVVLGSCSAGMSTAASAALLGSKGPTVNNVAPGFGTVNLTTEGTLGWSKYSVTSAISSVATKDGGVPIVFVNSHPAASPGWPAAGSGLNGTDYGGTGPAGSLFTFTDGTAPNTFDTNNRKFQGNQLTASIGPQAGPTFTFTVPSAANGSARTLNLYLITFGGTGTLTAKVLDSGNNPVPGDSYTSTDSTGTTGTAETAGARYSLTYSGGQSLEVTYKLTNALR